MKYYKYYIIDNWRYVASPEGDEHFWYWSLPDSPTWAYIDHYTWSGFQKKLQHWYKDNKLQEISALEALVVCGLLDVSGKDE